MTYEEHVARALLLDARFYPAYHSYRMNNPPTVLGRWLDADTLEDIGTDQHATLTIRRQIWSKHSRNSATPAWDKHWFKWREWK